MNLEIYYIKADLPILPDTHIEIQNKTPLFGKSKKRGGVKKFLKNKLESNLYLSVI